MSEELQPMLSGVRVVDLAHMLAGGYGSMLLGDLGAEVIKIEPLEIAALLRHRATAPGYWARLSWRGKAAISWASIATKKAWPWT